MLTKDISAMCIRHLRFLRQVPKRSEIFESAIWAVLVVAGLALCWLVRQFPAEEIEP